MKLLLAIFILFVCTAGKSFSQNIADNTIHPAKLPGNGILLDKGWKFHKGDNTEFANKDYNDKTWQNINPTLDIHDSLTEIREGIGWFRIHISIDSNDNNQIALLVQQSGASEIYFNGHLMQTFGHLSASPAEVKAYDPLWKPFILSGIKAGDNVIAVRYALQSNIFYTTIFETANPAIWMKVMAPDNAINYYNKISIRHERFEFILIGICIMLFILHLPFYLVYPTQKANLYFALFALTYMAGSIVQLYFYLYSHHVAGKFYFGNLAFIFFVSSSLFLFFSVKQFLGHKKDVTYKALIILTVIACILDAWPYGWGWKIGGAIMQLLIQLSITLSLQEAPC